MYRKWDIRIKACQPRACIIILKWTKNLLFPKLTKCFSLFCSPGFVALATHAHYLKTIGQKKPSKKPAILPELPWSLSQHDPDYANLQQRLQWKCHSELKVPHIMLPSTLHKRFLKDVIILSILQTGETLGEAVDRSSQATISAALGIGL